MESLSEEAYTEDVFFSFSRFNPEDGTCQTRATHTELKTLILTKMPEFKARAKKLSFVIKHTVLHGVTGSTVVGHVDFGHHNGGKKMKHRGVMPFTIDLDLMFGTMEPAASFAAIRFPFPAEVVKAMPDNAYMYPYYKSAEDGAFLAGVVSVSGKECPEQATVYSFKSSLDCTELEEEEFES